jgi:Holliday junction resolvase RusA-like endonuclease
MTVVAFSMVGEPRGKGRPRVFVQGGRSIATTDPQTRRYEASVSQVARRAMAGAAPMEGPLSVSIRFRMPIPRSATKRDKAAMAAGEMAPVARPDLDNLAKAILDGMSEDAAVKAKAKKTGIAADARIVFRNDSQIVRLFVVKLYAEQPGVDVRVEAYQPQGGEA